jgi:hypothetical protein
MSKLFLFGIGGTGSRVIKSLTMLMAAGVKVNATEVVPIIVDPHANNEDLRRTVRLLESYQAIYNALGDNRGGFFSTRVQMLNELAGDRKLKSNFAFQLKDVANERFKQYVDYASLDSKNKALADLLFSDDNLNVEMDIGFVGNPNIGSVVLNQFRESDEFLHFASNFHHGDRVFIISSIFGGTGAAGFPLILKNIRNAQNTEGLSNAEFLKNAPIGAVTVMPYFGVAPDPSNPISISKETFISKTKAALSYYGKNVTGNRSVNALYYLGDTLAKDYTNDPGANGQKNDAHLVEMVAALAVVDFMNLSNAEVSTTEGVADAPIYREFGVRQGADTLDFTMLDDLTQGLIKKPLTQFQFFKLYAQQHLRTAVDKNQPFATKDKPLIDNAFLTNSFVANHIRFIHTAFEEWLSEMGRNRRGFAPFNATAEWSAALSGIKTQKGFLTGEKKVTTDMFTDALNRAAKGKAFPTSESKLMAVFHEATAILLKENFYGF